MISHVPAYLVVKRTPDEFAVETFTDLGHWRTTDEFPTRAEAEAKKARLEKIASRAQKTNRRTFR